MGDVAIAVSSGLGLDVVIERDGRAVIAGSHTGHSQLLVMSQAESMTTSSQLFPRISPVSQDRKITSFGLPGWL